jgi:membrane protease YdiL (CAAX protease family)
MFSGYVNTPATLTLLGTALCIYLIDRAPNTLTRAFATVLTIPLCLLLAVHAVPGFANPVLLNKIRFTSDAVPYTQYANFDKASVGLLLIALACPLARTITDWKLLLRKTGSPLIVTVAIVMMSALAIGYVRIDLKLPAAAWLFAIVNLLFVCVAEEAFFRGFLQARLTTVLTKRNVTGAPTAALITCALLFGLAHFAGGLGYIALASVAGIGYGYAYMRTQRLEAAVLTHFAVNLVHFVGFTYPALAQ